MLCAKFQNVGMIQYVAADKQHLRDFNFTAMLIYPGMFAYSNRANFQNTVYPMKYHLVLLCTVLLLISFRGGGY